MKGKTLKLAGLLLGFGVSAFFLFLTFSGTDIKAVIHIIATTFSVKLLLLALLLNTLFLVSRAVYQRNNLSKTGGGISFSVSLLSISLGQMYNVVLPFRSGDLLRVAVLASKSGVRAPSALSYLVVEKWIDMCLMAGLFVGCVAMIGTTVADLSTAFYTVLSALALSGVVVAVYLKFNGVLLRLAQRLCNAFIYGKIEAINNDVQSGVKLFKSNRQFFWSLALLLIGWGLMGGVFFAVTWPFVVSMGLPVGAFLVFLVFSAFSVALPSAPSGVGVMHYALVLACVVLGSHDRDAAAAFAVVTHFILSMLDLLCGGFIVSIIMSKHQGKQEAF